MEEPKALSYDYKGNPQYHPLDEMEFSLQMLETHLENIAVTIRRLRVELYDAKRRRDKDAV